MAPKVKKEHIKQEKGKPASANPPASSSAAMGKLGAQKLMDDLKRQAKAGRDFPLQKYKSLKGHEAKRSFMSKWELDKEMCWLQAEESEWQQQHDEKVHKEDWCHLWDVARINGVGFNPSDNDQQTWLLGLVSGCTQRSATEMIQKHGSRFDTGVSGDRYL